MQINQITQANSSVNKKNELTSKKGRLSNGLNSEPDSFTPSHSRGKAYQPSFGFDPVTIVVGIGYFLWGALQTAAIAAAFALAGAAVLGGGMYIVNKISEWVDKSRADDANAVANQIKGDVLNIKNGNGISKSDAEAIYKNGMERVAIEPKGTGIEDGLNQVVGESGLKLGLCRNVLLPMLEVMDDKSGAKSKVPNGVNFFGPRGTGKSYLIDAMMDHYVKKGGYAETLHFVGDNKEDIATMRKVFSDAEKRYNESGKKKYTMVFLDELEKNAQKSDLPESHPERTSELLRLVKNCKDRGVVFISASNDLNLVNTDLLIEGKTDLRVPVGNIKIHDVADMINFYIMQQGYSVSSSGLDYNAITNDLRTGKLEYKPSEIKAIVRNAKKGSNTVTTEGLRTAIGYGGIVFSDEEQKQFNSELNMMKKLGGVNEDARYPWEKV